MIFGQAPKWAWSGHVTNLSIYTPLRISAARNDRALKFYTELRTEEYNQIYTQDGP